MFQNQFTEPKKQEENKITNTLKTLEENKNIKKEETTKILQNSSGSNISNKLNELRNSIRIDNRDNKPDNSNNMKEQLVDGENKKQNFNKMIDLLGKKFGNIDKNNENAPSTKQEIIPTVKTEGIFNLLLLLI